MTVMEKIAALRGAMEAANINAYYCADVDPHQSEYVADHWKSRTWLSGFDGSAGTLVVTQKAAALWTDSRYFLQGEQQLAGTGIQLMRSGTTGTPSMAEWLVDQLAVGDTLARDGAVVSVSAANQLEQRMHAADIKTVYDAQLLDQIWVNRPPLPATRPFEHDPKFTQANRGEKLARLQQFIREKGLEHYLIIGLDEIAWLLNTRGQDVAYNPLVLSYLLVGPSTATWFCGVHRVSEELRAALAADGVGLADYQDISAALQRINSTDEPIGLDPRLASVNIYQAAGNTRVQKIKTPIALWKSIKGPKEVAHIRNAMARDGVALLKLRRWLKEASKQLTNEVAVSDKLTALRAAQPNYFGDSFPAIVGYRGNGAIVHYRPRKENCAEIAADGMLLLDSGGQYFDGTTDITRTFHLGKPSDEEKHHFTLVLQGHINLAMAKFPKGTTGRQLDILARNPLWQANLDYGHGTGHGVGYFLNVHEGPMGIRNNHTPGSSIEQLRVGQILSNEPGYYLTDQYGIRIENLVVVKESNSSGWLEFEDLTVFPIERQLVDFSLLSPAQQKWLKDYHQQVQAAIEPLLTDQADKDWLADACQGW